MNASFVCAHPSEVTLLIFNKKNNFYILPNVGFATNLSYLYKNYDYIVVSWQFINNE